MPGQQYGHYAKGDLFYQIEHSNVTLLELQDLSYDFALSIEPGGAGIGFLKNTYFKTTGAPKGSGKFVRNRLQRSDYGEAFIDLAAGARVIIQEPIAAAAVSYTVGLFSSLTSIIEIRLIVSQQVLRENVDYTVNYLTGTVSFTTYTGSTGIPEKAMIRYLAFSRRGQNFILNGGFEDALGSTWAAAGTSFFSRTPVVPYAENYILNVSPQAVNDGIQYNLPITLEPGRNYILRFRATAAAAETLSCYFNNGTSDIAMTGTATLTVTWVQYEFTFTATVATVPFIRIKDTKATPALFQLDEVQLLDATTGNNPTLGTSPMDGGLGVPFVFNIIERRMIDGVIVRKLMRCAVDKIGFKAGKEHMEDVSFIFLDEIGE